MKTKRFLLIALAFVLTGMSTLSNQAQAARKSCSITLVIKNNTNKPAYIWKVKSQGTLLTKYWQLLKNFTRKKAHTIAVGGSVTLKGTIKIVKKHPCTYSRTFKLRAKLNGDKVFKQTVYYQPVHTQRSGLTWTLNLKK